METYIRQVKHLANTCNFPSVVRDELLRDGIVCGIRDNSLRKRLLREKKLTLSKTIDLCRGEEATEHHMKGIAGESPDNPIEASAVKRHAAGPRPKFVKTAATKHQSTLSQRGQPHSQPDKTCLFCGRKHAMLKSKCPAYGKKCHNCGQPNHFTPCCPKLKKPAVNAVSQADTGHLQGDASADSHICHVGTRQHNPSAIYAEMMVSDKTTKFLVDSGAACNILPLSMLPPGTKLQPATTLLRTYNGSTLPTEGTAEISLENPATQQRHLVSFEVVKGDHMPILGAIVVQDLNLLTVNEGNFRRIDAVHASVQPLPCTKSEVLERYAAVFKDTVGELPNPVHLTLDQNVEPVIMPARKIPLSLEDPVKNELAA